MNNRGSVLLQLGLISVITLAGVVTYSTILRADRQKSVHHLHGRKALNQAESGLTMVENFLRKPDASANLVAGSSHTLKGESSDGRYEVALFRPLTDPSLVLAYTTGYAYVPAGNFLDPVSQRPVRQAVARALFRFTSAGQYMIAVPGEVRLQHGADISAGTIYGRSLIFDDSGAGPNSSVGKAYYYETSTPLNPAYVNFGTPPQKLDQPPTFPVLTAEVREWYRSRAWTGANPIFSNVVAAPAGGSVYYVDGDVEIAEIAPLVFDGVWVLYATGEIRIHNAITDLNNNCWIAMLSEKSIRIMPTAPDALTLKATFLTNRDFRVEGGIRGAGNLTIVGGMVILGKPYLTPYQAARSYTFFQSAAPSLFLPNFYERLEYHSPAGLDGGVRRGNR